MWTIFKVLFEFVTIFFSVFCFGYEARESLASQQQIEPARPTLEGKSQPWTASEVP